jgi:hypothetical protein
VSLGESTSSPERLWTSEDGRTFVDTYPDIPGAVTIGTIKLGDVRRDALLSRDATVSMALAILTVGEPTRVEWGTRTTPIRHETWDIERKSERDARIWLSELRAVADRDINPRLIRREVYALPDGGSVTTGWQEADE